MHLTGKLIALAITTLMAISLNSCSPDIREEKIESGQLVKYDSIGYYSKSRVQSVVDSVLDMFMVGRPMQPEDFRSRLSPALHGVRLFKIAYTSVIPEKNNQAVTAYGLVIIPDSILPGAPIVSYQHGSVFARSWVPSNPDGSVEIQFAISEYASQGYIVIAADYFGTTEGSEVVPCFGVPNSTSQACLDMLVASKQMLNKNNITPGKLFLHGWSLGGASTNTFLRRLEKEKIPVAAAVTASGPADQLLLFQKMIIEPSSFISPSFPVTVSNALFSYEEYVGLDGYAAASIKPEFYEASKSFYTFGISFSEYAQKVLIDSLGNWRSSKDVFTEKFIEECKSANLPFWRLLDEANGYRYTMRTPYRAFYSNRDEGVVAEAVKIIVDYQKGQGNTSIEGFDAGPNADHGCVYLESLINAKPWFDILNK
jgi:hypothetical protein